MKSLGLISLLLLTACPTRPNPLYCDQDVACADPSMYCDMEDKRCRPSHPCEDSSQCTDDPGRPICNVDEKVCRGCESGDECEAAGLPGICTPAGECVAACADSTECPDSEPICTNEACELCTEGSEGDAACTERGMGKPYCVAGACVECRTSDDCGGEICDQGAGTCGPCTEHSQCASGACDLDAGQCMEPSELIYVDQSVTDINADFGPCTEIMPCETIRGAINERLEDPMEPRDTLMVLGNEDTPYEEVLEFEGITATIIGKGVTIQPGAQDSAKPVIDITGDANISIYGLRITGATDNASGYGIRCFGDTVASLQLLQVEVVDNDGIGVQANRCTLDIHRSTFSRNRRGGVEIIDSDFSLTNNFIVDNGELVGSRRGGVLLQNSSAVPGIKHEFAFNTVVRNYADKDRADASGVRCYTETATTALGNIIHSNLGGAPMVDGNCTWEYSNIEGGVPGQGNIDQTPAFVDAPGGDYHLQLDSQGVDVPGLSSDVRIDFDGDARPQGAGLDMGADEVAP